MEPRLRDLPVGFRFRPTEVEMSKYFLKQKVLGQPMKFRTIPEECHDLFSTHPRALPGDPRDEHLYFYCKKLNDQVTSLWTQNGEETNVLDPKNNDALVGIKRSFSLIEQEEEEEESNENIIGLWDEEESPKYNWFMDEISLPATVAESDWVLCHVFRKKIQPESVDNSS